MAYLGVLAQNRLLGEAELRRMLEGLEGGQLINPIAMRDDISTEALVHYGEIEKYLGTPLHQEKLRKWLESKVKERARTDRSRDEARKDTQVSGVPITFVRISARKFEINYGWGNSHVTLSNPFEIMDTPVTQAQWVGVMGSNPAHFKEGPESVRVDRNGQSFRMNPDNPVESITWWSAVEFANRLSINAKLKPTYDFSDVKFDPKTSAEAGNLTATGGKIKVNAPDGNFYEAEGYRLPTEAEVRRILRSIQKDDGRFFFKEDPVSAQELGWVERDVSLINQPVGILKPIISSGQRIHDFLVNVFEMTSEGYDSRYPEGKDPYGDPSSERGFKAVGKVQDATALAKMFMVFNKGDPQMGFRLVRTLKPGAINKKLGIREGFYTIGPSASPAEKFRWELCQNLVRHMVEKEISAEDFATLLGVSRVRVSEIINHRIDKIPTDKLIAYNEIIDPKVQFKITR